MKLVIKRLKKLDALLHREWPLLLLLLVLMVLRVPNFFEPYWYGDEGIYLTVANGLKQGERLYSDIIDHKTPLIYYLSIVPSQLHFRLLNLGWMMAATIAFYHLAFKLLKSFKLTIVSTFVFVFLTSVPTFEGNIPNGELFVMGFVLTGGYLLTKTSLFKKFLLEKTKLSFVLLSRNTIYLFLAGVLFGLGILTKVPALFDLIAFLAISWFVLTNSFSLRKKKLDEWFEMISPVIKQSLIIIFGVVTPILISIAYFISIGSGQDYLDFGLLYNFRYAANWGLPFDNQLLVWLFTLQGKFALTTVVILWLTFARSKLKPAFQLIASWFVLSLFASLLSNRPYPHYFQQIVPPLSLLVALLVLQLRNLGMKSKKLASSAANAASAASEAGVASAKHNFLSTSLSEHVTKLVNKTGLITSLTLVGLFISSLILLEFRPYDTVDYYTKFYNLITNRISADDYRFSFNPFMKDNYLAAQVINKSNTKEMFIWGTNPMLYALTNTKPTGRFTVSFHIKDFDAYDETIEDLIASQPLFIAVMNDEPDILPGLDEYLQEHYITNTNYEHFMLWKRSGVMLE